MHNWTANNKRTQETVSYRIDRENAPMAVTMMRSVAVWQYECWNTGKFRFDERLAGSYMQRASGWQVKGDG